MGQLDKAYEIYQKAFSFMPDDPEIRQKYGILLLQAGRYSEALNELQAVHDTGIRNIELISNLGYAYMDVGNIHSGIRYHEAVLAVNPRHADSIYGMALGHEKLGDLNRAKVYWQRFLDVTPPHNPWRKRAVKKLEQIDTYNRK
jgi:tetratricopeptide (TPR) repeat protein